MVIFVSNVCPSRIEIEAVLHVLRAYIGRPEIHPGTYRYILKDLGPNPGALLGYPG